MKPTKTTKCLSLYAGQFYLHIWTSSAKATFFPSLIEKLVEGACAAVHNLHVSA